MFLFILEGFTPISSAVRVRAYVSSIILQCSLFCFYVFPREIDIFSCWDSAHVQNRNASAPCLSTTSYGEMMLPKLCCLSPW